jgi:flagellar basal-body rod protein FlgB
MSLDTIFGVQEQALQVAAKRFELISSNLANVDTPGYRARDIEFKAALNSAQAGAPSTLTKTHERHLSRADAQPFDTFYRTQSQPTLDGNSVDADLEKVQFMENALRYQFALDRIDGISKSVMSALRGE